MSRKERLKMMTKAENAKIEKATQQIIWAVNKSIDMDVEDGDSEIRGNIACILNSVAAAARYNTLIEVAEMLKGKAEDAFKNADKNKEAHIEVSIRFYAMGRALEAVAECFETLAEEQLKP